MANQNMIEYASLHVEKTFELIYKQKNSLSLQRQYHEAQNMNAHASLHKIITKSKIELIFFFFFERSLQIISGIHKSIHKL